MKYKGISENEVMSNNNQSPRFRGIHHLEGAELDRISAPPITHPNDDPSTAC